MGEGDLIGLRHLAGDVAVATPAPQPTNLREAMRLFARHHILDVLARARFDKREAARLLGISLASRCRKLSVEPPDGTADEGE